MAKQTINTGASANDGTGDGLRDAGAKINENFDDVYSNLGDGTDILLDVAGASVGQVLTWSGSHFVPNNLPTSSGAASFLGLQDTPENYDNSGGYFVKINSAADAIEFVGIDLNQYLTSINGLSINELSDVDTSTTPSTGQVLKWDGAKWAPGVDIAAGGGGTDADTLDGFDSAYFLDYNNFTNTPTLYTTSNFNTDFSGKTSDDMTEGTTNTYYTDEKVDDRVAALLQPGTGITLSYDDDAGTFTINSTVSSGAADFLGLSDTPAGYAAAAGDANKFVRVNAAGDGLDFYTLPDYITEVEVSNIVDGSLITSAEDFSDTDTALMTASAIEARYSKIVNEFAITAADANNYTFGQDDRFFNSSTTDPVLYLRRGETYHFNVSTGGAHPLEIRVSNGGAAYTDGVTNNAEGNGTVEFTVPMGAPATLYYQCTVHSGMGNTINIV